MYGLPKVHKSEEIKKKIKESPHEYAEVAQSKDLKMRPIVAGPSSVTSKLSNYLDVLLKPLLRSARSKFWGLSGSDDRGGGDNSIQYINFGRVGDKSFKEWRQKIGGCGRVGDNNI